MKILTMSLIVVFIATPMELVAGQTPGELQKLMAANGRGLDKFGSAVDMDGTRAVIGGKLGDRVWVYEQVATNSWFEDASFQGPDTAGGDCFGGAVAVLGDTIVVGALTDSNQNGALAGSAYVFVRTGGIWVFQQKLLPSGSVAGDRFGSDLAMEGDTVVVSSFASPNAYVFVRTGTVWTETQAITLTEGGWAFSVALNGSTLAIGSPGAQFRGILSTGATYLYRHDGAAWVPEQTLLPSVMDAFGEFGYAVRLSGDTLVATARNEDIAGAYRGAAYVFRDTDIGWVEEAHLTSPKGEADNNFGWFADIECDRVVVSEHASPGPDANSTYLFERTGSTWGPGFEIVPAPIGCDQNACRSPVALSDPYLLIGADNDTGAGPLTGAAYVYLFPEAPSTYCTGKLNSVGCTPQMSWTGQPTLTGPDDFVVSASQVLPGKNGIFFFGTNGSIVAPLLGGTLCVNPPLKRSFVQQATMGPGCSGAISYLFSQADMQSTGLNFGDLAHGQFWLRDPSHPDGSGSGLSNAIEVQVQL